MHTTPLYPQGAPTLGRTLAQCLPHKEDSDPRAHPHQLPSFRAPDWWRWRCLRPLVCIHVLMDNHLPLLTLHGFHCALAHALPSSWHALLTTHAQVLPILQSVAQTLPSPEVTHLPAEDNALPSLTLSCPFSVPSGTEHFLPWSYPGPSLSHSPT